MNNALDTQALRLHLDLPVDRAAKVARSISTPEHKAAIILRGPKSFCAVDGENSFVGFADTAEELQAELIRAEWVVGYLSA